MGHHRARKVPTRGIPMLKKIKDMGEEQVSKLAERLLSNEAFMTAVQKVVERTMRTREAAESFARFALGSLNLPTRADIDRIATKVEEIEELLDELSAKLDAVEQGVPAKAASEAEA